MSPNTAQLLAEIPLFSTMDDEERRQLGAIMRQRSFQPGQVVAAASDPEATFFIIEQGEMEVWLTDTDGKAEASSHSPRCLGSQGWEIGSIGG